MSADTEPAGPPEQGDEPLTSAQEPVERLVYFFLPVAEPLQLPDGYRIETHDAVPFSEFRQAHLETGEHPEDWDGTFLVASSRIWQTTVPRSSYLLPVLEASRDVAHKAIPTLARPPQDEDERGASPLAGDEMPQTIVEVAVRVDDFGDQIGGAFEVAVECVQSIQRAHYLISHRPLTLVTVENAPVLVHMAQREARLSDGPQGGWPDELDLYMPNMNLQPAVAEEEFDAAALERFQTALDARHIAPFAPMAQLTEEAKHALHRRGDYRAAITLLHSASEALLDTALMHMLWEENKTPAEAFAECFATGGLQTRLKSHYSPRLRGNWNLDQKGPLAVWNRDLASVRHRIVHAAYLPSREEAHRADATFDALQAFIIERVSINKFLRDYPVTTLSLVGTDRLKESNRWPAWLEQLTEDPVEIDWTLTFGRWRQWLDSLRSDAEPVPAEDEHCVPVLLLDLQADDTWWLHDVINGRIVQTDAPADAVQKADEFFTEFRNTSYREFEKYARPGDRASIAWAGESGQPLPDAPWLPEHEVLPFHGIMRDGSDERAPN